MPDNEPHLSGRVAAVEYQGPVVRIALETDAGEQAAALLPDETFFARPGPARRSGDADMVGR